MRIGNFKIFQDALDRAVFTEWAMQRIEGDIGPEIRENGSDVTVDIHTRDLIALAFQRGRASLSRREADRPLRRKPTHKNSYVLAAHKNL
jgi:hypothetical protein